MIIIHMVLYEYDVEVWNLCKCACWFYTQMKVRWASGSFLIIGL